MKRVHIIISGKVQGVCFRSRTKEQADMVGVYGWVKNSDEGDVEVVIEGEDDKVDELVAYCNHGPTGARVDKLTVEEEPFEGEFKRFEIQY